MKVKLVLFIYKWLPIFFGCHGKAERSFIINHRKFPICARCTGELVGILLSIILFQFIPLPSLWLGGIMLIPMLVDGFLQRLTSYESKNWKRFITGLLFGVGFCGIFAKSTVWLFHIGMNIGYWIQS